MNDFLRRILYLPEQASTMAPEVDHLHYFMIITTMIAATVIGGAALFFYSRYRRKRIEPTPHLDPTPRMEVAFVAIPMVVFMLWFAIGFRQFVIFQTPPPGAMDVYVMGKKWMWKFAYPDGPNAIGVLRVPAHRPVRLLMTSRDVIHSFFVPAFRMKQDVLPGRYTETWFEATTPGRYQIFCAEFCGVGHSSMWGEVVVLPPEEFDAWMQQEKQGLGNRRDIGENPASATNGSPTAGNLVNQGRQLAVQLGCLKCHSVDGTPHIGPSWLDMYHKTERLTDGSTVFVDEAYMTESMMDPRAKVVAGYAPVMPTFQGRMTAPETAAIVEFIRSLRSDRMRGVGGESLPTTGLGDVQPALPPGPADRTGEGPGLPSTPTVPTGTTPGPQLNPAGGGGTVPSIPVEGNAVGASPQPVMPAGAQAPVTAPFVPNPSNPEIEKVPAEKPAATAGPTTPSPGQTPTPTVGNPKGKAPTPSQGTKK